MTLLFLAACHIPVGWPNSTGEKRIGQIGAVLGPAHFFSLIKKYKGIQKRIMKKNESEYFQNLSLKMNLFSNLVSEAEFLRFRWFHRHSHRQCHLCHLPSVICHPCWSSVIYD